MGKERLIILLLLASLSFPALSFAETIILKSGQEIEGKVIEKTDKYIKIDFEGAQLTYFFDDIKTIDGNKLLKEDLKAESAIKPGEIPKPSVSSENVFVLYTNTEYGFSLKKPSDWLIDDKIIKLSVTPDGSELTRVCHLAARNKYGFPDVGVVFSQPKAQNSADDLAANMAAGGGSFIQKPSVITIDNTKVVKFISEAVGDFPENKHAIIENYIFLGTDNGFWMNMTSFSDEYENYKPIFEKIAESFKILDSSAVK
jgi:hypothetical protein